VTYLLCQQPELMAGAWQATTTTCHVQQ